MKNTKRALLTSVLALVMCVVMLVGSTFAWFTDSVVSAGNKIVAGKLDVELYMHTSTVDSEKLRISTNESPIFGTGSIAQNNNAETLWEPGKTQVAYLEIANEGNLALKYKVAIEVRNDKKDLYEVMEYAIIPDAKFGDTVPAWNTLTNAKPVVVGTNVDASANAVDVPLLKGESHYFALAVHMLEEAGNEYQEGEVSFDIKVLATQETYEEDSYSNQYDANATYAITAANKAGLEAALATGGNVAISSDIDMSDEELLTPNASSIDLGGNALSVEYLSSVGSTTISNGTLALPADGYVYAENGANVTVEDVVIESDDLSVFAYTGGTLALKDVTLASTSQSNPVQNYGGTLVLDGVTASQSGDANTPWYSSAIQVINEIVKNDAANKYEIVSQANTTIYSGNYSGKKAVMISAPGGNVTINGGTFVGTEAVIQADFSPNNYLNGSEYESVITINGGNFTGAIIVKPAVELIINGGTFSIDPSTIATATINGTVTANADGTYTVA